VVLAAAHEKETGLTKLSWHAQKVMRLLTPKGAKQDSPVSAMKSMV